tara:strand:- start:102 stop:350 length:249 start_codon:yes stop_codon:yes gene_type:complete
MGRVLSKTEIRILAYLSVVDILRRRVKDIHEKIDVEYSYLCMKLRTLSTKGLLKRHEKNKARNAVVYCITDKGREVLKNGIE